MRLHSMYSGIIIVFQLSSLFANVSSRSFFAIILCTTHSTARCAPIIAGTAMPSTSSHAKASISLCSSSTLLDLRYPCAAYSASISRVPNLTSSSMSVIDGWWTPMAGSMATRKASVRSCSARFNFLASFVTALPVLAYTASSTCVLCVASVISMISK